MKERDINEMSGMEINCRAVGKRFAKKNFGFYYNRAGFKIRSIRKG